MRILIVDPQFEGEADIEAAIGGPDAVIEVWRPGEVGQVPADTLARCDALINFRGRNRVTAATAAALERCRIVVQAGVGVDNIDLAACAERAIPVCHTPDYGTCEVADHAMALALALVRGVVAYDDMLRRRAIGWEARALTSVRRLFGARFGIVGLGRIGIATALRARAFGTEVAFYDPYVAPGLERALAFRRAASLAELMGTCEIVSVHTPLTRETARMIDAAALDAAAPGLLLVNTARGGTMDLDAVEAALRSGQLGGAALDVLPQEPPDFGHPLLAAFSAREPWLDGRLVITPHAGFFSPASIADMRRIAMQTALDYLHRGALRACVNATLLPAGGPHAAA